MTNKSPLEISHALITLSILSIICFILVFEGYISKPESPNPQLPTCSESPFPNLVAQGLPFLGGNMDNLWNRNKPFQSEKEFFIVEPAKKLTWIGDSGLVVLEPTPGNIFAELKLPPVNEDPGLPNLQLPGSVEALNSYQVMEKSTEQNTLSIAELHDFLKRYISIPGLPNSQLPSSSEEFYLQNDTQVAQGLPFAGGIMPLPSFGDHNNQRFPPPLVETSYTSLNASLIYNGNSNGTDLFEGYISIPGLPNSQLPSSSEEFYFQNDTQVAQGLPFAGGIMPLPSFGDHNNQRFPPPLVETSYTSLNASLIYNGNSNGADLFEGYISIPGLPNSQLPSSSEELYLQNDTQVAQGLPFAGGIMPLPSFGDHNNQRFPPPLVETSYTSLNASLIYNGNSNGADLGLSPQCKRAKLCSKGKDQRRPYNKFSPDERNNLIEGVQRYATTYSCWIKIKNEYFKNDPHRTPDNLKQKWKHMMERDPSLKKLYKRALIANKNDKFKSPKCK
ncbi:unnamed protein product [Camellia sinensis]